MVFDNKFQQIIVKVICVLHPLSLYVSPSRLLRALLGPALCECVHVIQ